MAHDLCQPMQRHGLRHAVAKAMPQVMRAEIADFGQSGVFCDEIAQSAFRQRSRLLGAIRQGLVFIRLKEPRTICWKRGQVLR